MYMFWSDDKVDVVKGDSSQVEKQVQWNRKGKDFDIPTLSPNTWTGSFYRVFA